MRNLYERVFYANYAKAIWFLLANFFHDEVFRFLCRHFAVGGDHEIEDQIDIRFAFRHTEIVYRKGGVNRFRALACDGAHGVHFLVVDDDRV